MSKKLPDEGHITLTEGQRLPHESSPCAKMLRPRVHSSSDMEPSHTSKNGSLAHDIGAAPHAGLHVTV